LGGGAGPRGATPSFVRESVREPGRELVVAEQRGHSALAGTVQAAEAVERAASKPRVGVSSAFEAP